MTRIIIIAAMVALTSCEKQTCIDCVDSRNVHFAKCEDDVAGGRDVLLETADYLDQHGYVCSRYEQ